MDINGHANHTVITARDKVEEREREREKYELMTAKIARCAAENNPELLYS